MRKKIYWYNHISWTEIFKKNLEHTKCFLYAYRQATNFIKPCLKNLQNKKKFSNTIWKEAIFSASSLDIFHTTQNIFKVQYVISKYIMRNVLFSVISLTYKYFRTSQIKNCRNRKKVCICHNCYDNLLTWKWNMLENARKSCRMLWFFTKTTCTKNELPKSNALDQYATKKSNFVMWSTSKHRRCGSTRLFCAQSCRSGSIFCSFGAFLFSQVCAGHLQGQEGCDLGPYPQFQKVAESIPF